MRDHIGEGLDFPTLEASFTITSWIKRPQSIGFSPNSAPKMVLPTMIVI